MGVSLVRQFSQTRPDCAEGAARGRRGAWPTRRAMGTGALVGAGAGAAAVAVAAVAVAAAAPQAAEEGAAASPPAPEVSISVA